jgi:NAD(P)-dependent dehydrogenase (short-subunit alcohol dehydrogenase family)
MNARDFKNKVAVITGAGSGIGQALAVALANEGVRLALSDIDAAGLARTTTLLPAGTEVRNYRLDVTDEAAVFAHADEVLRDFGTAHLLFNNAGSGMLGSFEHQALDEVRWLIDLDLWSVVYCTRAFLPAMRRQNEGWIVNISSIAGLVGLPGLNTYNVVKFAVRGLTESLWAELAGTGVQAVCVHPGGIKTNIERAMRRCRNAGELEARTSAANARVLVTPPGRCAADIVAGLKAGKRRILTGNRSSAIDWIARLLPDTYPRLLSRLLSI